MSNHNTAEAEAIVSILHESQVYRLDDDDLARLRKGIAAPPPDATCGYAVTDSNGEQAPCDRPAHGWRWYQDVEHEDMIDIACVWHENVGGAIIAGLVGRLEAVTAERDALAAAVARVRALHKLDHYLGEPGDEDCPHDEDYDGPRHFENEDGMWLCEDTPGEEEICGGCPADEEGERVPWPCPTICALDA